MLNPEDVAFFENWDHAIEEEKLRLAAKAAKDAKAAAVYRRSLGIPA